MFSFLNKFKSQPKDFRMGHIMIEEVLPIFHDSAKTTNKTVYAVVKGVDETTVKTRNIRTDSIDIKTEKDMFYNPRRIVTQNGEPVQVFNTFKNINCDLNFTKEGYKKDQIYSFVGLGYLGNLSSECKVKFVTDQFVFFEEIDSKHICIYSYQELQAKVKTLMWEKKE